MGEAEEVALLCLILSLHRCFVARQKAAPTTPVVVCRSSCGFVCGTFLISLLAVLLGAPLASTTLYGSAGISALSFAPLAIVLGADPSSWSRVVLATHLCRGSERQAALPAGFALFGAWAAAAALCLDWGSSWLQWPLPVCLGAAFGHFAGAVFAAAWCE
jgi:hypothetical protein